MEIKNYKDLIEEILEYDKKFIVVWGWSDIILDDDGFKFKDISQENIWRIIGRVEDNKAVLELHSMKTLNVDLEGEYEFKSIMKWESADYDSHGRCTYPESLIVEHIELKFIQTFIQRERDSKLENFFKLY